MSLSRNTKRLLEEPTGDTRERTAIEYHFLSGRELYDKSIVTADRYSSGAAEWVIRGDRHFYTASVVSRPYHACPQELCLFFDCFSETKTSSKGLGASIGPPIEDVAIEFITLLSTVTREPLFPLGIRRNGDRPIRDRYSRTGIPRSTRSTPLPPAAVDSAEFISILKGFASAAPSNIEAALAAARFYHAGLSLTHFDPSGAYVSLVSSIECLAGNHYKERSFDFECINKFQRVRPILDEIEKNASAVPLVTELKTELVRLEYFLRQKFVLFILDFLPESFWTIPDDLYPTNSVFPIITKDVFSKCLKDVYDARSKYVHVGLPFPSYVQFGLQDWCPVDVLFSVDELKGKEGYLPPISWFERVVHLVLTEYLRRTFAPDVVRVGNALLEEKTRLIAVVNSLPVDVRGALERLTLWTAQFIGYSVINPHAPNAIWTKDTETRKILQEAGLIGCHGEGPDGTSWLKNRDVGESVGEVSFGIENNPFRSSELLLPKGWEDV